MASVFIKVPVGERLPKEEGVYIVGYEHGAFSCPYNKQYSFHEEFTDCSIIEYWLEEIELPTEEEVTNLAKEHAFTNAVKYGANFILDKLKGGGE